MKIVILTAGSRGDVQPYLALAIKLNAEGYSVTLGADRAFEKMIRAEGINYALLRADYYTLMDSPEGQALKSGNPIKAMQYMKTTVYPLMKTLLEDAWAASQGAELILYHPKVLGGAHIAEALNIPPVIGATLPLLTPTRAFPMPGIPVPNVGVLNKLTYKAAAAVTAPFKGILSAWREETLNLPAKSTRVQGISHMDGKPILVLYAVSPTLIPTPDDWHDRARMTGFWMLEKETGWHPSPELAAFMEAGDPPIYVGFGSMVDENPAALSARLIAGIEQAGVRAVLASGWGGLQAGDLPPSIHVLQQVPHSWLFPRVQAVVHHGGAGTTAAGLAAGKPTIIIPFIADQPFWGDRVEALGVGRKLARKALTAETFAEAVRFVTSDSAVQAKAARIGDQLRAENGVEDALRTLRAWFLQLAHSMVETGRTAPGLSEHR